MKSLELKIPPLIVTLVFGVITFFMPNLFIIKESTTFSLIAVLLLINGIIISILGVVEFKKSQTTVNPMTPEESSKLVMSGIYNKTRNPMYLGFLLWLISLVVYLKNPLGIFPIACFIFYMNYFQIIPEEEILLKTFGKEYSTYMRSVRRWI